MPTSTKIVIYGLLLVLAAIFIAFLVPAWLLIILLVMGVGGWYLWKRG